MSTVATIGTYGTQPDSAPPDDPFRSRRVNGRYQNLSGGGPVGFGALIKWAFSRNAGPWDPPGSEYAARDAPPPRVESGARVTFVNHATVLLQVAGLNIVTDPIWADRASPVQWAGPKRARQPGFRFDDLPVIDVILLSHNHYDHMCAPTLRRLAQRDAPRVVTGLGNSRVPRSVGLTAIRELDWWEGHDLGGGITVTYVPARHFSARGMFDRMKALWGGFYLATPAARIYFAADSGWGDHFAEIGRRLGPPDFSMIPIGAYRPRSVMAPVHIDPQEAVEAHRQVGSRESMAIHFGTFPLTDDGQHEPAERLSVALARAGLTSTDFWVPAFGEGRDLSKLPSADRS